MDEVAQFSLDYSFFLNLAAIGATGFMIYLHRRHKKQQSGSDHHNHDHGSESIGLQTVVTWVFIAVLLGGLVSYAVT